MPAYYAKTVSEFLGDTDSEVLACLANGYSNDKYQDLKVAQIDAWKEEIQVLRQGFLQMSINICGEWGLLLEFTIPRRKSRIDAIILIKSALVVLEFKKSEDQIGTAVTQVEDYALELEYFHETSTGKDIYPTVVAGGFSDVPQDYKLRDNVRGVRLCAPRDLPNVLDEISNVVGNAPLIGVSEWEQGRYFPVPTVIEAAVGMFSDMEVGDIAHADADPKNLGKTIAALRRIVSETAKRQQRCICIVTGVPGAGKTLAGLSLVHDREIRDQTTSGLAFISGNLPLVEVLQRALYEDQRRRNRNHGTVTIRDSETLIQTVYGFKNSEWIRDENQPPAERVIVFDEAQRAWDRKANLKKLRNQDKKPCDFSEPELILHILNRHHDWAALICLVGGGQEIHTGEAGLQEWGAALTKNFPQWKVYASPVALNGKGMQSLFGEQGPISCKTNLPLDVKSEADLHLDNPLRQFRGKTVAAWVEQIVSSDHESARKALSKNKSYPIALTRSLETAKGWLRDHARGSERFGLLASSESKRLRSYGIHVPGARDGDIVSWFLKGKADIRASFQMEVAATEFQVQGLELDWAAVCWGGDFLQMTDGLTWELRHFEGTNWNDVKDPIARAYVANTYRVLLTRARMGMILYVPEGKNEDVTTTPEGYERTASFLSKCGIEVL